MSTPRDPLPKRRPLRTREEILQAGHSCGEGMWPAPEPAERLATLLMLAFPAKPRGAGTLDATGSTGEQAAGPGLRGPGRNPQGDEEAPYRD